MNSKQICQGLLETHGNFTRYLGSLSAEEWSYHPGDKWSAGQHLDHICRSVAAVNLALILPRWFLRWYVGMANRPSRSYEELVARYHQKLSEGGRASGRFVPAQVTLENREKKMKRLMAAAEKMGRRLTRYSEANLDKYILPHPLLGKLTIREMLYFTVYHVGHHQSTVTRQLDNKKAGQ